MLLPISGVRDKIIDAPSTLVSTNSLLLHICTHPFIYFMSTLVSHQNSLLLLPPLLLPSLFVFNNMSHIWHASIQSCSIYPGFLMHSPMDVQKTHKWCLFVEKILHTPVNCFWSSSPFSRDTQIYSGLQISKEEDTLKVPLLSDTWRKAEVCWVHWMYCSRTHVTYHLPR